MKPILNITKGFTIGAKVELIRDISGKGTGALVGTKGVVRRVTPCSYIQDKVGCPDDYHKEPECCNGYMTIELETGDLVDGCFGYHDQFSMRVL